MRKKKDHEKEEGAYKGVAKSDQQIELKTQTCDFDSLDATPCVGTVHFSEIHCTV